MCSTAAIAAAAADANHIKASVLEAFMAAPASNGPATALMVKIIESTLTFLPMLPDTVLVPAMMASVRNDVTNPPSKTMTIALAM